MKIRYVISIKEDDIEELCTYLDSKHADKGYLVSSNFSQRKQSGVTASIRNGRTIAEAVV